MALAIRPASGTTVSVSAGLPATVDTTGYEALTFTELKGADNVGELGTNVGTGTFTPLNGAQQFYRTVRTAPSFDMAPADLPADAGQGIVQTAADADPGAAAETISLKIEDSAGYITYFKALVLKSARMYGGAEDLQMRNMSFQPNPASFVEDEPA